jgi:UDP-glucose 4-epimerase
MKRKKILVTGGAGYIGSHTAVELVRAGYAPVIADNFSNAYPAIVRRIDSLAGEHVPVHKVDCTSKAGLEKVFAREGKFHGIIHFAAFIYVGESIAQPLRYYHNNIESMRAVLDAAVSHRVPHFVFSSSCTVYGQPEKLPVRETMPLRDPLSPYGETKKITEGMLRALVRSGAPLKGVAVRYFNPIGAHPSGLLGECSLGGANHIVPLIVEVAAGIRKKLVVLGDDYDTVDGTCVRDYIDVVDVARAHIAALAYLERQKSAPYFDVFNIGAGRGHSVFEVIRAFSKATGVNVDHVVGARRAGDIGKIYANVDKARELLGWKARVSLEDSLLNAWTWQKKGKICVQGKA